MKLALALVGLLLAGGIASANPGNPGPPGPQPPYAQPQPMPQGPRGGQRGQLRAILLQHFDRNGDGRLEPQERKQAARALRRIAKRLGHATGRRMRQHGRGGRGMRGGHAMLEPSVDVDVDVSYDGYVDVDAGAYAADDEMPRGLAE